MVRSCSLKNCNNSVRQKYRFFLLPSVKKVAKRAAWLKQCDYLLSEPLPTTGNSISLCEGHFEPDQFVEYGPNVRTILKPTAIPTIFTKNPPRVCDAVEQWYDQEYKHNSTLSLINDLTVTDDSIIYHNDNQDNEIELEELNNDNDDNGYEYEYGDVDEMPVAKIKSTVRLIRIQRNKMQIATPHGIKIIAASCKTQMDNLVENQVVEHFEEGLSPPSSNEMETIDDNSMPSSTFGVGTKKICLDVDNKAVAYKVDNSGGFGSLDEHEDAFDTEYANYCDEENGMRKRKLVNAGFKKQPKYEITPVFVKKEVGDGDNHEEVDDKSRLRDIMHFNISQADSVESNDADADSNDAGNFDPALLDSYQNNYDDNYIMNDDDQLHEDRVLDDDDHDNDIDYSQLIMNATELQKQVKDLENERDSITRKYRRLELKMETFETNLRTFLNDDQIKLLQSQSPSMNTTSWSADTLKKSAKIRCIVGPRAYEYLRSQEHYPLPSFRTLYRHRDVSRINDYTDEMIQEHMNATINRVAMVTEESEASDLDDEAEAEAEAERENEEVETEAQRKAEAQREAEDEREVEEIDVGVDIEKEFEAQVDERQVAIENNSEPEHIIIDMLDPDIEDEEIFEEEDLIEQVQDILMNNDDEETLRHEDIAAIDGFRYVAGRSAADKTDT